MYPYIKRGADFALALVALCLLSPIMALTSIAILLSMGRPIVFRQTRPGRHKELFDIFKFRTMSDSVDADGELLPDADRITATGRFLRRSSIDELPQLLNILRGEMSFIGPRPLLIRYLPYFREHELARFRVLPGVAGLAQVRGRNTLGWDERIASDVEYVNNLGLGLDTRIALAAVRSVLQRSGIVDAPSSFMQSLDEERANEAR